METLRKQVASLLICWVWLWALGAETAAGAASPSGPPPEAPINITAAHLEADHEKQEITFSGQVVARHKDMILYADILKIFYEAKKEAGQEPRAGAAKPAGEPESPLTGGLGIEKIARIEAQGHVRLVQEDKVASGEKAVYYKAEEKIVLTGNPQLWRGDNSLKGDTITFYLTDNRAVVAGAPQKRVEATITPSQSRGSSKPKLALPGQ